MVLMVAVAICLDLVAKTQDEEKGHSLMRIPVRDRHAGTVVSHKRILKMIQSRYDQRIMNNIHRSDYVECMIVLALGNDWRLPWSDGWEWAPWDCVHRSTGTRLEIKQAAADQIWDQESSTVNPNPRFDIAPRKGYWLEDGSEWVDAPGRLADIYVFAWHGRAGHKHTDQRDANQWDFFVLAENLLPDNQKSIGLSKIRKIVDPCTIMHLQQAVESTRQSLVGPRPHR